MLLVCVTTVQPSKRFLEYVHNFETYTNTEHNIKTSITLLTESGDCWAESQSGRAVLLSVVKLESARFPDRSRDESQSHSEISIMIED